LNIKKIQQKSKMIQIYKIEHQLPLKPSHKDGILKQNAIRRMRFEFIKIVTLQNKTLATKRPEMRDGQLAPKAKLKGGQMQNRPHENPI
jgi:hypothetical protein